MDNTIDTKEHPIILDQHIIEGWGLWWIQWQKDKKEHLRKSVNRTRVNHFSELHLISSESGNQLRDATR